MSPSAGGQERPGGGERCSCSILHSLIFTCTQIPGDSLTARVRRKHLGRGPVLRQILNSSAPLSLLLAMAQVQALLLVVGVASLLMMLPGLSGVVREPAPRARCAAVRFTVLSLRGGGVPNAAGSGGLDEHGAFGVLLNGCEVKGVINGTDQLAAGVQRREAGSPHPRGHGPARTVRSAAEEQRFRQYLAAPAGVLLEFNGISLVTATHGKPDHDPATFIVECMAENEVDFTPIAASGVCGWFPGSGDFLRSSAAQQVVPAAQVPLARREMVKWDYSATRCMQATYLRLISALTFALALVTTAALHFYIARVRVSLAELPSAMQMLFGGVSSSIVLVVAANVLEWRLDYIELWTCLGLLGLMGASGLNESYLSCWVAVFGLYEAAALVALQAESRHLAPVPPHDTSLPGLVQQYLKSTGSAAAAAACAILLSVGGLVLRWWMLRKQMGRVEADKVWQALVSDAQARSVMQQAEVLSATPASSSVELLRHTCPAQEPGLDRQVAVTCLDQLYFQAAVVAPMLLSRCESGQRARRAACLRGAVLPLSLAGASMHHDWCAGTSLTLTEHPCLILSKRRTTRSRSTTGILLGW